MKYIVVDLEMNPMDIQYAEERALCMSEIIEIGAVLLDESFQEIGSFMTLVKPQYSTEIRKSIVKLTGITTEMVQSAPAFQEAADMFFRWCSSIPGEIEICQWSVSDYHQFQCEMQLKQYTLNKKAKEIFRDWCDFQCEYGTVLGVDRQLSLKQAIMYAGIEVEGRLHDALDDARNTAHLVKIIRIPELRQKALDSVIEALKPKPMTVSLGAMFDFSQFDLSA